MTHEEYIESAVAQFRMNDYWGDIYSKAPSEKSRTYIELNFATSWADIHPSKAGSEFKGQFEKQMLSIRDTFDVEDWKYLASWCGNNPLRGLCRRKIKELQGDKWDG